MQLKAKKEGKTLASDSHMVTKSYNLGDIYQDVCIKVYFHKDTLCTNQMGYFHIMSRQGNQYIILLCEYDSNYIDTELMKDPKKYSLRKTCLML